MIEWQSAVVLTIWNPAAGDIKNQLMFIVAFVFNVIYVFFISKMWIEHKISFWVIFILAWVLDILVLFSYQWTVFGSLALITAVIIGLLPAAIIAVSVRRLNKRSWTATGNMRSGYLADC